MYAKFEKTTYNVLFLSHSL